MGEKMKTKMTLLALAAIIAFGSVESTKATSLGEMPDKVLTKVFMLLEPKRLEKVSQVNKRFHRLACAEYERRKEKIIKACTRFIGLNVMFDNVQLDKIATIIAKAPSNKVRREKYAQLAHLLIPVKKVGENIKSLARAAKYADLSGSAGTLSAIKEKYQKARKAGTENAKIEPILKKHEDKIKQWEKLLKQQVQRMDAADPFVYGEGMDILLF